MDDRYGCTAIAVVVRFPEDDEIDDNTHPNADATASPGAGASATVGVSLSSDDTKPSPIGDSAAASSGASPAVVGVVAGGVGSNSARAMFAAYQEGAGVDFIAGKYSTCRSSFLLYRLTLI